MLGAKGSKAVKMPYPQYMAMLKNKREKEKEAMKLVSEKYCKILYCVK